VSLLECSTGDCDASEDLSGAATPDETWRSLAEASRDTLRSLETALVAQERALNEAQLLCEPMQCGRPSHGDRLMGPRKACTTKGEPVVTGVYEDAVLPERWRALRHAVDARRLHWRLQLERYRSESMSVEHDKRARYTEDLEKRLEYANAEIARLKATPPTSHSSCCRCPCHEGTDANMTRLVSSASAPDVSLDALGRGMQVAPGTAQQALGSSADTASNNRADRCHDGCKGAKQKWTLGASHKWTPVLTDDSLVRSDADNDTDSLLAEKDEQIAMLQKSQMQLNAYKVQFEVIMASSSAGLAKLHAEISSRDVRLSMLKHEVSVKDSLLDHLRAEKLWRSDRGDEEIELLLEQAMTRLATMLAQEGARCELPSFPCTSALLESEIESEF